MTGKMDKAMLREMVKRIMSIEDSDESNREAAKPEIITFDVSAVRRILQWSIEQAEQQLANLHSAMDVINAASEKKTGR